MKTWTLVWFLVFPPAGVNKDVTWEYFHEKDVTYKSCIAQVAEKVAQYDQELLDGNILGYEAYCKDQRGTSVPIEKRN